MSEYLIVESRDPFDSKDVEFTHRTAKELAAKGRKVTIFLVQNGVLPARKGTKYSNLLEDLKKSNVAIWADNFSLKERAISSSDVVAGVEVVSIDQFVKTLVEQKPKTFWH